MAGGCRWFTVAMEMLSANIIHLKISSYYMGLFAYVFVQAALGFAHNK